MKFFGKTVLGKPRTRVLCLKTSSRKSCRLWSNVKKYGRARQATEDNVIRRMVFAYWINRVKVETHTSMLNTYWVFHSNNGYANSPRYYII